MPIIQASIKDLRKSRKHREVNKVAKNKLKDSIKEIKRLITDGKRDEAQRKLSEVVSVIDKAAKNNLLHKNNAARKKSALARLLAEKK